MFGFGYLVALTLWVWLFVAAAPADELTTKYFAHSSPWYWPAVIVAFVVIFALLFVWMALTALAGAALRLKRPPQVAQVTGESQKGFILVALR